MTLSSKYTDFPLELDADTKQAGTEVYVNGMTRINPNLVVGLDGPEGQAYNTTHFLQSGQPVANFQSGDIKKLLDELDSHFTMLIDSGGSGNGVNIFFAKKAHNSLASGSVHHKTTIGDGILTLQSLRCAHQGSASITAMLTAVSADGLASPLTFDESAALPVIYPLTTDKWTLGKVDIDGTALDGKVDVGINSGIPVSADGADSDPFPTVPHIAGDNQKIQPTIDVTSSHINLTSLITELGLSKAASTVNVWFKKRAEGSTFVADVTEVHIKFTLGKCLITPVSIGMQMGVRFTPVYTPGGSPVYPLVMDTTAAIT